MELDDRTALLEELPNQVVTELIKLLSEDERKVTLALLGYPEYVVVRLMTSSCIGTKQDWTTQQVVEHVRRYGEPLQDLCFLWC